MDVVVLKAIVEELRPILAGGRIASVSAPGSFEIAIAVRAPSGGTHSLLLSADPAVPRIHLVPNLPADAVAKAPFGQFVKKYLRHGIINDITQEPWERAVVLEIAPRTRPTPSHQLRLIAEIMGRRSNLVLIETAKSTILDAARTIPRSQGTRRPIMKGERYLPPTRIPGGSLYEPPPEGWDALAEAASREKDGWKLLVERFAGLSPTLAKEALSLAAAASSPALSRPNGNALRDSIQALVRRADESLFSPAVYYDKLTGKPSSLFAFPLAIHDQDLRVPHATMNDAAQAFYARLTADLELEQRKSRLAQTVGTYAQRLERALSRVDEGLAEAGNAEELRRAGDLLLANFPKLHRGINSLTVRDEYDASRAEIVIELDPKLDPAENAARYFRQAAKTERARRFLSERRNTLESELAYLRSVTSRLAAAPDEDALVGLEENLRKRGYVTPGHPRQPTRSKTQRLMKRPYRTFTSSDGWEILAGRSAGGNDHITCALAARDDLFLHAHGVTGSHVIVRNPRRLKSIPEAVIEKAAVLAAYYSRARHSSRVEVSYAFRRHVSKPRGAKPGLVYLSRHSTITVDPATFERTGLLELDEDSRERNAR